MADENHSNPIAAALADLRARRDQLDQLIRALEAYAEGGASAPYVPVPFPGASPIGTILGSGTEPIGPGTFHGMGIEEATRKLLKLRKTTMSAQEIASALKEGGLHLQSSTPANTIASVLSRAFANGSDIVRVSRGQWGLQEWYPTRRFTRD
jgi:hypothetical protein